MKKLFALMLALAVLFLTACNTKPPVGTTPSGTQNGETPNHGQSADNWMEALQGKVVSAINLHTMIDLPSRIIFEGTTYFNSSNAGNVRENYLYYYSKADGKVYVYCFDPLCEHTDCMANLEFHKEGWTFDETAFYNNRFYSVTAYGQILSFSFDGSDKKIEYDLEYVFPDGYRYSVWNFAGLYGPYLYLIWYQDVSGSEYHILRYNLDTKEMEDLTEKTGNCINPSYFYNGYIYGDDNNGGFLKADLDLNTMEPLDHFVSSKRCEGNFIIGYSYNENNKRNGITIYNIETGETKILTNEELGLEFLPYICCVTDEYIYFADPTPIILGTLISQRWDGTILEQKISKGSGKLYRMNLDGTNVICVYDNPDYEITEDMVIYGDKAIMLGYYFKFENQTKIFWGGPVQVATINPDGTFGEFVEAEVLE